MKYSLTEQKALKKLGIKDFRHMTKDKVVQFASMLPKMDPEVAKAAIDQFPEFKSMAIELTSVLNDMVDKAFKSAGESEQFLYNACNDTLITLREQLNDEHIDNNERKHIRNNIIEILNLMSQKDTEHKKFVKETVQSVILGVVGIAASAAIMLGSGMDLDLGKLFEHDDDVIDV